MHDHYFNKFIQKLIFGNSGTAKVLLMVLIFLLNLAAVMGIDGFLIHNIPATETDIPGHYEYPDFTPYIDGEILDTYGNFNGFHILYQTEGETRLVEVKANDIFYRYRIDRGSEVVIPQADPYVYDSGPGFTRLQFTIENHRITELSESGIIGIGAQKLLGIYMVIALVMLLVEGYILRKVTGKE